MPVISIQDKVENAELIALHQALKFPFWKKHHS